MSDASVGFDLIVMPGEGIGPEIIAEAVAVLEQVVAFAELPVRWHHFEVGEQTLAKTGSALPAEAEQLLDRLAPTGRAAVLFGACVDEPIGILRKRYDLYANLRPVRTIACLLDVSPMRAERIEGVDLLLVRELVSGIYYGPAEHGVEQGERWAGQQMVYREGEIRRFVRTALELAAKRRSRLSFIHKGNVIKKLFELWLEILHDEARQFPTVEIEDLLVDNMAMQMMLRPRSFDVIATTNLFGDILSEVAAGLVGSLGLVGSISLAPSGFALYEPVGGTAPDIAGRGVANPVAAIVCAALLCQHGLSRPDLADAIHRAIEHALVELRTPDIARPGMRPVSTRELGEGVRVALADILEARRA